MHKIEQRIKNAINTRKGFITSRDSVEVRGDKVAVTLHQSEILSHDEKTGVWQFSLCGYNTNTTRGRLNALLPAFLGLVRRNYKPFLSIHKPIASADVARMKGWKIESATVDIQTVLIPINSMDRVEFNEKSGELVILAGERRGFFESANKFETVKERIYLYV